MDIYGIGTDLVKISRIEHAMKREQFLRRCFTAGEIVLLHNRAESAAGRWAAKEAAAKALRTGFLGFWPNEIEILRDEAGGPSVVLHGRAAELAAQAGVTKILISISHEGEYAVGFAAAVKE